MGAEAVDERIHNAHAELGHATIFDFSREMPEAASFSSEWRGNGAERAGIELRSDAMPSTLTSQDQRNIRGSRQAHQGDPSSIRPGARGEDPLQARHHLASFSSQDGQRHDGYTDWNRGWNGDVFDPTESYYYEPQGELVRQEKQAHSASELHFPAPVTAPAVPLQTSGTDDQSVSGDSILSPQQGRQNARLKRKLTGYREVTFSDQQPRKRPQRMSGGRDDRQPSTIQDEDPGPNPRPGAARIRSATDAVGNPPRRAKNGLDGSKSGLGRSSGNQRTLEDPITPLVLPARKVFPIQIGDRLFRLSGASISSDAPSYFSQFFEEQLRQTEDADSVRTLHIDRDPATFEDISLHLQGYHIEPRDGPHFVKLFADAQFFSLPRLTAQLSSSTIYVRIGDAEFQIPRDLFSSPGDSPNYFSLGFSTFFTSPSETFPGLKQRTLLRPPAISPPRVPNRSANTFAHLLHVLKGYPIRIKSEEHRAELLRDARYFHLKGLEQRLIPHKISYNVARQKPEILIRLEDLRQSGVSVVADSTPTQSSASGAASPSSCTSRISSTAPGWVHYQRPYVDSEAYSLILDINEECIVFLDPTTIGHPARLGRATFFRQTLARITSLFSVVANKMNLPVMQPLGLMMLERGTGVASLPVSPGNTGISDERVRVRVGRDASVTVDGRAWELGVGYTGGEANEMDREDGRPSGQQATEGTTGEEWAVKKSQWRLRIQFAQMGPISGAKSRMEVIMGAVKMEAFSSERGRNESRGFLT